MKFLVFYSSTKKYLFTEDQLLKHYNYINDGNDTTYFLKTNYVKEKLCYNYNEGIEFIRR